MKGIIMSRTVIARLFYGSLLGMAVAIVLGVVAFGIALSTGSFVWEDNEVVGVRSGSGWWAFIAMGAVAALILVAAWVAQFVAWIGALVDTAPRENKTWFVVLLVGGLLGFGLIVMLVYVLSETGSSGSASASPPPVSQTA
jgi:hypothetical protein